MNLLPKDTKFFDLLDQQAENVVKSAEYFRQLLKDGSFDEDSVKKMRDFEHEGDTISHEIMDTLNRSFITPFDREDIHDLTGTLDDIVDRINSVTTRIKLYKVKTPDEGLTQFGDIIEQAARTLVKAVHGLRDTNRASRIQDYCIEVNRLENAGDLLREKVILHLFETVTDPIQVIKWKELYELSEATTDECEHVAKVVESILVKQA